VAEAELTEVVRVVAFVTTEVMVLEEMALELELELLAALELEEEAAAEELEEETAAAELEDEETDAVVAAVGAWI